MATKLNPYLGFRDNAREALDFYQTVFGGEITRSTFAEMYATDDPTEQDKIMHSELITPSGFTLMASDTPNSMPYTVGDTMSVAVSGNDEAELHGYWESLSDGANVTAPFEAAPWGGFFGMCVDRFGINWMVSVVA